MAIIDTFRSKGQGPVTPPNRALTGAQNEGDEVGGEATPPTSSTVEALLKYIPTEAVSLYLLCSGVVASLGLTAEQLYWIFVMVTFVITLWLSWGTPENPDHWWPWQWPWWKLFINVFAFMVWALTLPEAPYFSSPEGDANGLVAVAAVIVTTLIAVFDPVVELWTKDIKAWGAQERNKGQNGILPLVIGVIGGLVCVAVCAVLVVQVLAMSGIVRWNWFGTMWNWFP